MVLLVLSTMLWILAILFVAFVVFSILADADFVTLVYDLLYRFTSFGGARLQGQVVWITGASSGIGEELAYKLASRHCKLVLSARREEVLDKVKQHCLELARRDASKSYKDEDILVLPFDMLDIKRHQEMMEKVMTHFNRVDILVNNAGRSQRSFVKDASYEVFKALIDLDLLAQISLTKTVLPQMIQQKSGHFLAISSLAGKMGVAQSAGYSAAKHALGGFFHSLAFEVASSGICVTVACPGPVVSHVIENCLTETLDSVADKPKYSSLLLMPTIRCADLLVVSLKAKLQETWISRQPFLLASYLAQYTPSLYLYLSTKIFVALVAKMRTTPDNKKSD